MVVAPDDVAADPAGLLAGAGGAIQIPREPANLYLDLSVIADAFVVVVVGGLGSIPGAFLAALLIAEIKAFCHLEGAVVEQGAQIGPYARLRPGAQIPDYQSANAAGMDLVADLRGTVLVAPGQRRSIPTGIALEIPPGYEGQVRPRSGRAIREGLTLINTPGTIDADYRGELGALGVGFDRLLTIANMPIARFAHQLHQWDKYADYMGLLVNHFNPDTVDGLMCRALVSVGWDGRLYDCDFNQMLEMPIGAPDEREALTVWDLDDLDGLAGAPVATGPHCFGCTAGAGSSCGGALIDP